MTPVQLIFNGSTADEVNERVKDYLSKIKGSRGPKGAGDETGATGAQAGGAPPPAMPPGTQGFGAPAGAPGFGGGPAFAPPGAGAGQPGGAFPAAVVTGPAPEVLALAQRIAVRFDAALASGQNPDQAIGWLRSQIGPEAAAYNVDQCKQALVRLSVPALENAAKLMGA